MTTFLMADLLAIVVALTTPVEATRQIPVPFSVGERLEYDVKFGVLKVGNGTMEVVGIGNGPRPRGLAHGVHREGRHVLLQGERPARELDRHARRSLRSASCRTCRRGSATRAAVRDLTPSVASIPRTTSAEQPPSRDPLDDGSFLYFIRTVPLEIGQTYEFTATSAPIAIRCAMQRAAEGAVRVPAGRFDAIVIQPIIKSKGIFSENGQAEIWFSDDDAPHHAADEVESVVRHRSTSTSNRTPPGDAADRQAKLDGSPRRGGPLRRPHRSHRAPAEQGARRGVRRAARRDRSFAAFLASLPDVLVARDFRRVVDAIVAPPRQRAASS